LLDLDLSAARTSNSRELVEGGPICI